MFPSIFKYNSVISVPLFATIALTLIGKTKDFSFKKHTVSKSVLFLKHPVLDFIFRLNFILKALLDLGFIWYVIHFMKIPLAAPVVWCLVLSMLLFASLAYFVEGKYSLVHKQITYVSGVLWFIGTIFLALLTKNAGFIVLSWGIMIISLAITYGFSRIKKVNIFVQAFCMLLMYGWVLIFVFYFL